MTLSYPINPSYPDGDEVPSLGDNKIRLLANGIVETLGVNHKMVISGAFYSGDGTGEHNTIAIWEESGDPTVAENKAYIYVKPIGTQIEMFFRDGKTEAGGSGNSAIQLTLSGDILLDKNRLSNNVWLTSRNSGDASVNLMKCSGDDVLTLAGGFRLASGINSGDADLAIANKSYVDDEIDAGVSGAFTDCSSGGLTGTLTSSTDSWSKLLTFQGGLKILIGYQKRTASGGFTENIDISSASFTGIYYVGLTGYDDTTGSADRACHVQALTLSQLTYMMGYGITALDGVFYKVEGY